MEHPFWTNEKRITSEKEIKRLKDYGVLEIYIDTERGLDLADLENEQPSSPPPLEQTAAPPEEMPFVRAREGESLQEQVPLEQEVVSAGRVLQEAHLVVRDLMNDIRSGRKIRSETVKRVVNRMIDSILRNRDALSSLSRIKGYDEYTFVHSINVCVFCLGLGRDLGFGREELEQIGIGALLHDIGKMRVPRHILMKPARLTEGEFAEMKNHTLYGVEILDQTEGIPEESKKVAREHHERHNGKGYPAGTKGDEISRFGQMAAIIDVYDAITSVRCYRKPISPYEGMRHIYRVAGEDFNPILVERFIQCVGIYPVGTLVQLDTGEVGIISSVNRSRLLRPRVLLLPSIGSPAVNAALVDLMEKDHMEDRYKRTILRPLDPGFMNIDANRYLPGLNKTPH